MQVARKMMGCVGMYLVKVNIKRVSWKMQVREFIFGFGLSVGHQFFRWIFVFLSSAEMSFSKI